MEISDLKTKIDRSNEKAWMELDCDPSGCLSEINKCLLQSKDVQYNKGIGEALVNRGKMNFHLLNYQQALSDFQEAGRFFSDVDWSVGKIRLYGLRGQVNAALGEFRKAIECYEESLIGSRICNNAELEVNIQANLGQTYLNIQEYSKAIPFFEELERKLLKSDHWGLLTAYNGLAETYLGLNNCQTALEYAQKALETEHSDRDRIKMIESLEIKGRVLAELGQNDEAVKTFQAAITLCDLVSHKAGKAQALYSLGKAYLTIGLYDYAIREIQLATAQFEELESKTFLAKAYKSLALAYEKKEDFEQALLYHKLYFTYHTELLKKENAKKIENLYIARELERIEEKAQRLAVSNSRLVEENTRMKTLIEIGQEITSSLDLNRLLIPLYDRVKTLMQNDCFGIGSYIERDKVINNEFFIVNGKKIKSKAVPLDPEKSLSAWCIVKGKDIFIDDIGKEWRDYVNIKPNGSLNDSSSIIYVPLSVEDRILGFITVQSKQKNAYTEVDLGALKILSAYVAIAMDNARIHNEVQKLYGDIVKEHKDLEASYRDIESIAVRDKLTGLYNRQFLEQLIDSEFSNTEHQPFCVLYLDLDCFKPVNDMYGHFIGDLALKEIANRLQGCMRESDELVRIGGDEFVAIMRRNKNKNAAGRVAEKIIHEIKKPVIIDDIEASLGVSIGISIYPDDGHNIKDLIKKADNAMYSVKRSGKFSFKFYTQSDKNV